MEDFKPAASFFFLTPFYDFLCELMGFGRSFKLKVIDLLSIKGFEKILDIGCGTGTLIIEVKKRYPNTEILGIDPDEEILKIAGKKLKKSKVSAKLIKAYAQALPFPDSTFDLAVSTLIFHHLKTDVKKKSIKEIYRVLKKRGRFLLIDFGQPKTLLSKILLKVGAFFEGKENMEANLKGKLPLFLEGAGFEIKKANLYFRGIQFLEARK